MKHTRCESKDLICEAYLGELFLKYGDITWNGFRYCPICGFDVNGRHACKDEQNLILAQKAVEKRKLAQKELFEAQNKENELMRLVSRCLRCGLIIKKTDGNSLCYECETDS